MDELIEILENIEDINFTEITDIISAMSQEGRELKYQEGEIGITSLLDCPRKIRLQQIHGYPSVDSLAIEDGFIFEKLFKLALKRKYGDKFKEELELPIEVNNLKIRGHLDCAVFFPNTIVGIELKHTIIETMPTLKSRPPKIILLNPEKPEISLNPKYIKQAKIQKYILEKLYPDKEIKQYLFVKTTLKGAYNYYKSYILLPVTESISEEEFNELVNNFINEKLPDDPSICKFCQFYNNGLCNGIPKKEPITTEECDEEIFSLLEKREKLLKEIEAIEKVIKQKLKNKNIVWNGMQFGKIVVNGYKYNIPKLFLIIKDKGFNPFSFLQVKPTKIKDLEFLLGEDINLARTSVKREKFVMGFKQKEKS